MLLAAANILNIIKVKIKKKKLFLDSNSILHTQNAMNLMHDFPKVQLKFQYCYAIESWHEHDTEQCTNLVPSNPNTFQTLLAAAIIMDDWTVLQQGHWKGCQKFHKQVKMH